MTETILIPTDGTEYARRAAAHGIALADRRGADVHALFVVDTRDVGEPALSSIELLINEYEDQGREALAEIEAACEARGVPVSTRVCHGDPTTEICAMADQIDADLIVVGRRGETHTKKPGEVARQLRERDDRVVIT